MQNIFHSFSRILKVVLLSVIFLAVSPTSNAQSNSVLIRVSSAEFAQVADIEAIHTIDYGAFVWLELTPENLAVLQDRGVQYEPQRAPEEFQFPGIQINANEQGNWRFVHCDDLHIPTQQVLGIRQRGEGGSGKFRALTGGSSLGDKVLNIGQFFEFRISSSTGLSANPSGKPNTEYPRRPR